MTLPAPPTYDGIERALPLIRAHLLETPLIRSEMLSALLDAEVWLKNETASPIASFKLRGALAAVAAARDAGAAAVVTSSTGNHGQGVALAARMLGLTAEVFLPAVANPVKRARIAALGAAITEIGEDLDAAKFAAMAHAAATGAAFIDDGDNLALMEGAGTVGLELGRARTDWDAVYVPMGSGTLAGGVAAALKTLAPGVRVIAVQAKGSPAMVESWRARRPIERPAATTADGLICRIPADLALSAIIAHVDDALLASDDELLGAVRTLLRDHVLVEPSGAAALAGALQQRAELSGKRVALILTGANITEDQLALTLRQR